jgi:PAS domain-containing protein
MFEAALVALDLPVLIHGPKTILFANEAACDALKAANASAIVGADISSIVHPDGADAGIQRRGLVLEHGQTIRDLPVKLRALDDSIVYARVVGKRIAWAGSMAILIIATEFSSE